MLLALALLLTVHQAPAQGRTDYAVVVHPDNPTRSLSSVLLWRMLRAEVQEWPSHETVQVLLPRSGTNEKQVLLQQVFRMTDLQLKRYWTGLIYENRIVDAPRSMPSSAVALQTLERTRWSLTVVLASEVPAWARVVEIDGLRPGDEKYPLFLSRDALTEAPKSGLGGRASEASASLGDDRPQDDAQSNDQRILERLNVVEEELAARSSSWLPPNLTLFGHIRAEVERETSGGKSTTNEAFAAEVLDLLFNTSLTERASILAELVVDAQDEDEADVTVTVARLLLKYRFSDTLNLQGGRFLSTLGYWNSRYHHGEWLQTSIDRPEILNFERDGGLLPIHNVGLAFKGGYYGESAGIDYALEVANGRAPTPDETQEKVDENDPKSFNLSVGVEPNAVQGLRIGGGFYLDDIPSNDDPGAGSVHGAVDETIYNGYCVFKNTSWEVMSEYFLIRHDDAGTESDSNGWYLQIGRHLGAWTPYLRYDAAHRDDQDPYWSTFDDTSTVALGLRYDLARRVALTLQYEHTEVDLPSGDPDERTDTMVLQASF